MKVKRWLSEDFEVYKLDVWIKAGSGKRKLALLVRKYEEDIYSECSAYGSVIENIRRYLATKPDLVPKYLPLPEAIVCQNNDEAYDNGDQGISSFFILEDVRSLGFKNDISSTNGLDYEHSIMAIATLAKFHATSYCYRKENVCNMRIKFPTLRNLQLSAISSELQEEIEKILATNGFENYSGIFASAIRGDMEHLNAKLDKFGVVCHGSLSRENVLFKYKNQMDMKHSCQEAILVNLDHFFFG